MPNWITNQIKTTKPVILHIMSSDDGRVDFQRILPFPGQFDFDGVNCAAETIAEALTGKPLDSHPLIASLEAINRKNIDIRKLDDEGFEQLVQMLRNHRTCGFLHNMDFNRAKWGAKWNACESSADPHEGTASFETAWSCPVEVLTALSLQFPSERIDVIYADEDIGSNCGRFVLLNGIMIEQDIAPPWRDMDQALRSKWRAFACEVTGRDLADYEDE